MKKIILSLVLVTGLFTALVSCNDEALDPVASVSQSIVLSAPTGGTYTLSAANASSNAFTAQWTSSEFGFSAAARYTLQVIKATGSFDNNPGVLPLGDYSVNSVIDLQKVVTNRQLNAALLGAGGTIGASQSYKIRVVGSPLDQSSTVVSAYLAVSNEVTITATAFDTYDEFDRIYVPGGYQAASGYPNATGGSWAPEAAPKLFSPGNDGNYVGYVYMNEANPYFKFTTGPSWDVNFGHQNDGDFTVTTSSTTKTVTNNSGNLKGSGVGTYRLSANFSGATKTVTAQKIDYGLIGQFNGWSSDVNLDFDTTSKKWEKTVTLATGGMLLRGNDDWGIKMGAMSGSAADANLVPNVPIKLKEGGSDIQVQVSGSYKVIVDLRNSANYTMMIVPN